MAEDMNSDTSFGLKRRITETKLNQESLYSISLSPNTQYYQQEQESEIVPTPKQETDAVANSCRLLSDSSSSSFNGLHHKKVKCSSDDESRTRENQELGFGKLCDFVSGSSGVEGIGEYFGVKVQNLGEELQETQYSEIGFVSDVDEKQGSFDTVFHKEENSVKSEAGVSEIQNFEKINDKVSSIEEKEFLLEGPINSSSEVDEKNHKFLGKDMELGSFLEEKEKLLPEKLGLIPTVENFSDSETSGGILDVSTFIKSLETEAPNANSAGEKKDGFKGIGGSVRCSLKVKVIDDTALIEMIPIPKIENGRGKETKFANVKKNGDMEMDGKNVKKPRRRGKGRKKFLETNGKYNTSTQMAQAQIGCLNNDFGTKKMYSRSDMEALRFDNIVEQRKKWKEIYTGLKPVVVREYDDLLSWKHEKQSAHLNFDPRQRFEKKADTPAILREVCSGNVDNVLENMENNETEDVDPSYPARSHSVNGEENHAVLEGEYSEDDESDEDYASIQRPAFLVKGEPNFESGPPEDGL